MKSVGKAALPRVFGNIARTPERMFTSPPSVQRFVVMPDYLHKTGDGCSLYPCIGVGT